MKLSSSRSLKIAAWAVVVWVHMQTVAPVSASSEATSTHSQLWPNGTGTGWNPMTSRLQDFTTVGYMSGAVPIPDWPIGVDVTQPPYNAIPGDGVDDSQAFLDAIADCPDHHAVYVPNGVYTILQRIDLDRDHVVLRGQDMYQTILDFPRYLNEIYIQQVGYQNPAYDDGSNGARYTGVPKGFVRVQGGTQRSIENFTFRFRNQRKMGHWEHKGASAIAYSEGTVDSWIRNICVINGDHGLMIGYSFRLSILNIVLDHTIDRPDIIGSGPTHRWVGHIGIAAHNTRRSLFHNVRYTGDYFHELDNNNVPKYCVFSNFSGPRLALHHHGGGSNNNLYTQASVGAGPGIASLGTTQSNETHWNIVGDSSTLDLPTAVANLDNYHVFVGYDADTSALPLDGNGNYITAGAWWETIDPGLILPQNIYLAQMEYLLKPLPPPGPPPTPPSHLTGPLIRLNPTEDTYTDAGDPDTTQNPLSKSLMVGNDMYFKFDLTSFSLSTIAKVRFRVATNKMVNTPVGLAVYSIPDTWSADTITYNSAPLVFNELGTVLIEEDSFAQILEFDVTSYVQTEWAIDKVVSLVIKRTSGSGFLSGIRSMEMGIAPELIIEQVASAVAGPPSAPQDVRSYSLIGNVQLDWADNPEADVATYNVYRSISSQEFRLYEEPIAMALVSSDFVDVQHQHNSGWDIGMLRNDTVYYYRVTAVDAHGYESEASLEIVGTAKGYLDNNLAPSFNADLVTLPAATQYLPYSGSLASSATDPEGDPLHFSKINGPNWLSISDDGTVSGTPRLGDTGTFQFAVQVNSLGSGRDEATIEITVAPGPPDAPTLVDTTPADASAKLDWGHDSEGSAGLTFAVYRATGAGGPYTQISSGLTTSTFTDTDLTNGVTYYFVVTASNAFGESPFSGEDFVIPVQGLAIATNFLGGDMNDAPSWGAGLPVGQWGRIQVDGTIDPSDTTGYAIVQTGGKIRNADFLGTSFSSTEWYLHDGELETRGLSLKDSSSFYVNGNGVADLGNNSKDCGVYTGSSFLVDGGAVTFGRHMRINEGSFTVTGGTITGASNTDFGVTNLQGSATMNFNGGTSTINRLDLRGSNSILNLGGSAAGSLTASSFVDVFGTNTFINVLPATRMSLTISAEDEWAEAKWAAGDLTYNGQDVAQLGAWASVTSTDGLDTGVHFQYDSAMETLTLFTASLAPAPPEALSATPGDEESSLVWQLVNEPDVTGYKVYRATTSGGPYTLRATLAVTAGYLDTGLQNGLTYFYVVTAVDASSNESEQSAEALATPIEPNVAPVFTTDPVVEVNAVEDMAYSSSLANDATDANTNPTDILSFRKVGGPAWLSVAPNGDISGTPVNADVGLNSFTVEVSDGKGGIDTAVLEISVLNTNDAPIFIANSFTSSDAMEDSAYSSTIATAAMDPDGDLLSYSKLAGPAWLIVASNGGLSGNPENSDVGLNSFSIEVSDGNGGTDTATLEIMVINTNDAPVFATDPIVGQNGFPGFAYIGSLAGTASDVDAGDVLTYTKIGVDMAWLTVAANGDLSGTPTAADLGTRTCTIEVFDGNGGTATAQLQITVTTAGTDFLGGDLNDATNWDNGLPNAANNPGTIAATGTIHPTTTVDFRVTQTSGTISNADFQGTRLNGGEWNLEGGTLSVRGFTLASGTTAFKVSGSGFADLGNNNKDVLIESGSQFSVSGGTVKLGRKLRTNGGTFTISDGSVVGDTDTLIGSASFHSGGVLNFNGGTTAANQIGLQGSATTLNLGGDQVGSLTVVFLTSFGVGSTINFLPDSLMSLTVSGVDEWAEAAWNAGHLTYNGQDITVLGTWATVTSSGFGDGFYFSYDSVAETLSLAILITDFLGGDINDPANWDNGLPNTLYQGTVSASGTIQPSATSNYKITQTGGSISNADFRGTTLDGGEWNLEGGSFTTRGLSLSAGTTAFTVSSGAASLGNNNKDVILNSGTSFSVTGGSVTFGRDLEAPGGVFTVSGGVVTGDTDTRFGGYGFQSGGVLNFNGGITTGHGLNLQGSNILVNLGGTTPGSVSVETILGTNGLIDWKVGSKMSLAVTNVPDWAEAEWNAGRLTYDGKGASILGTWADVSAQDGLAANVRFDYDSATGTLMLGTGAPP